MSVRRRTPAPPARRRGRRSRTRRAGCSRRSTLIAGSDAPARSARRRPDDDAGVRHVVVSIPMRTRFRGITVRESTLVHGPAGWGEFAPFLEYDAAESRALVARGDGGRDRRVPRAACATGCRSTSPCRPPTRRPRRRSCARSGCRTAKVKVAEQGQDEADDLARLEAVRVGARPARAGAHRRQRPVGRRHRPRPAAAVRPGRGRPGVRRAAVRERRGAGRGAPPR